MNKLKVGDKVKLIKELDDNFTFGVNDDMRILVSNIKVFTISEISADEKCLRFEEDGKEWLWDITYFCRTASRAVNLAKVDVIFNGDETIVTFDDRCGKAKKNYNDSYDEKIGVLIAGMRALNFDSKIINNVSDLLFDVYIPEVTNIPVEKTVKDFSTDEILGELKNRL